MLDIQSIRKDFPILQRTIYDHPLIYFDNSATTQKPRCVVEKIEEEYYNVNANIHRGVHFLSQQATEAHEEARKTVQRFLNARSPSEIIFTRGTTEAINLVASSFTDACMSVGDEVIVSVMEHHSNIVPWQIQAAKKGISLKVVPINERGELIVEEYEKLFSEKTRLVSLTHVSNVLGTVNPIRQLIDIAHNHGVPILIDGAQAVPHIPVDVQALDAEFYAFSGHKIYGPTGIGILYGKEEWLDRLPPYQGGGEMIASVSFEKTTFNELPFKFEAGTPDYIGSTALAEALRYVSRLGINEIAAYEHSLLQYATEQLKQIEGTRIFGEAAEKSSVISFLIGSIHHYDMGMLLDRLGIAVRTGHHCAEPLMHAMGIEGTVRASFAFYNTIEEIDSFIAAVERVRKMFLNK
ncbi:aminotransferase class V-fold PLP-dependent enzyme [Parabacteroides sp. Marseille-P3160]|uniref:aminotransferase class V-fold PLP-dependent enzyme n=1 Tax=Parabacteroides sp. Marseille-P3160 TaxID=1917887 RepID=UPI0009B9EAFC|nr:cysteine desulfurase [Parabacteroides sp. Marseille-P3160]